MNIIYQPINSSNHWMIFVIIFMIFTVVLLKSLFTFQFNEQLNVFNKYVWKPNFKPSYFLIFNIYNFLFSLLFSFGLAFIIVIAKNNISNSLPDISFYFYLKTVGFVFLFLAAKLIVNLLFSVLFDLKNILIKVIYLKILYLNFISLIILTWLPFVLFAHKYSKLIFNISVLTTIVLALLFYVLLIKTNLKLLIKYFLYFILYLCALEIAPIIILYKVFIF